MNRTVRRRPPRLVRAIALLAAGCMVASNALAAAGLCAFKSPLLPASVPAEVSQAAASPAPADIDAPCPGHATVAAPADHPLAHPHCTQDQASTEQRAGDPGGAAHAAIAPPPVLLWTVAPVALAHAAAPAAIPPPEPAFLRVTRLLL